MTSTPTTTRYLLNTDDDGHWYLLPEDQQDAFDSYVASEGEGPFPQGVISLGSHPNTVTFEKPQHFGEPVE